MRVTDATGNIKNSWTSKGLVFGSTTIPLSSSAPSSNQLLGYDGTNIVGFNKGMQKISTATASSSATIDFTGLTSVYACYMIHLDCVAPATNTVDLLIRTSTDGGSTYDSGAGNYQWTTTYAGTGGVGANTSTADTSMHCTVNSGNGSNESSSGIIYVHNPSGAKYCHLSGVIHQGSTGANPYSRVFSGIRASAADVDAIRFLMSSGNIASGTFTLYGLVA